MKRPGSAASSSSSDDVEVVAGQREARRQLGELLRIEGASALPLRGSGSAADPWRLELAATDAGAVVLRGLQPLPAIRQSFVLCKGHFWQILVCIIGVMIPLWLIDALTQSVMGETPAAWLVLLFGSFNGFLTLFSTLVSFRLFMLVTDPMLKRAES